jgi:hypothetical protein
VTGQRLPDGFSGAPPPGAYWREGEWWMCCTPNGRIGSLANHQVTEHEDGTITVSPSILVYPRPRHGDPDERSGWHGFLERGVWREC